MQMRSPEHGPSMVSNAPSNAGQSINSHPTSTRHNQTSDCAQVKNEVFIIVRKLSGSQPLFTGCLIINAEGVANELGSHDQ